MERQDSIDEDDDEEEEEEEEGDSKALLAQNQAAQEIVFEQQQSMYRLVVNIYIQDRQDSKYYMNCLVLCQNKDWKVVVLDIFMKNWEVYSTSQIYSVS